MLGTYLYLLSYKIKDKYHLISPLSIMQKTTQKFTAVKLQSFITL